MYRRWLITLSRHLSPLVSMSPSSVPCLAQSANVFLISLSVSLNVFLISLCHRCRGHYSSRDCVIISSVARLPDWSGSQMLLSDSSSRKKCPCSVFLRRVLFLFASSREIYRRFKLGLISNPFLISCFQTHALVILTPLFSCQKIYTSYLIELDTFDSSSCFINIFVTIGVSVLLETGGSGGISEDRTLNHFGSNNGWRQLIDLSNPRFLLWQ